MILHITNTISLTNENAEYCPDCGTLVLVNKKRTLQNAQITLGTCSCGTVLLKDFLTTGAMNEHSTN